MFGRRSKIDRTLRERGVPPESSSGEERAVVQTTGPFDLADAPDGLEAYTDFGALKLRLSPQVEVRLEMSSSGELNGISLVRQSSVMQLGVFAAPRSGGAWESIREDILTQISQAGGTAEVRDGEFGPMIISTVQTPNGPQESRFLGVEGPRWFLRALIAGEVAHDDEGCEPFFDIFRTAVVERGSEPKPVREPITLRLPAALADQVKAAASAAREQAARQSSSDG